MTAETDGTEVSVSCIAVRGGNETFLLYTVDVISVSSTWATPMKNAIYAATGVKKDNILISTTHTHSGVGVNYDWIGHADDKTAYMEKFYAAAVAAGSDAIADMAQAQVRSDSVATENMAFVRHTSAAAQPDGQLQLVQLQRENKKDIVLMSFPVHATFMESGTVLSADFPGYARAYVEANYDALVAYFIGTGGNQTPTSGDSTYKETADDCQAYGEKLGNYAVCALEDGLKATENTHVVYSSSACTLDTNMLTAEEASRLELAKEVKDAAETYGNNALQTKLLVELYGFESVYQAKAIVTRSTLGAQNDITIRVLTLSRDVAFVFAPYEMFSNEGLAIKAASPYDCTFMITCSNANNGYIPSDYAWEINGCYEVQVTRWAKGTAWELVEAYTVLLSKLKNKW